MAKLRSSPRTNKLQSSPRNSPRNHRDSPSRQLELDLERTFTNIRLHDQESQKLYVYHRKTIQDELDAKEYAQAIVHKAGIDDALAKHEIVRQQAVAVLEAHIREEDERRRREEEERQRREDEEKRRAEEERRVREDNECRAREAREKDEAARRAAEERAKAEQEERERRQREDTAQREKEAKDKADADAATAAKKQQEDNAKIAAEKAASQEAAAAKTAADPAIRHKHYLDIHQKLKTFRKDFWAAAKKDPNLKPIIGDMRRTIRVAVGQLSIYDKENNSLATNKVRDCLLRAKDQIPSPPIILNDYLPPHLSLLDKNTTTVPALLLYLISMFTKSLVEAFANECSVNPAAADPLGTMAAQIFSLPGLQYQRNIPSPNSGQHYDRFSGNVPTPPMAPSSVSLISILVAKYHAAAPLLFGVNGSENTQQGRTRIGWRKQNGTFVPAQTHYNRMVGLAAGYASIALRNFSKAKSKTNPYPPIHFWESLSYILNTPSGQIQISHLLLLKNMLELSLDRFLLFFGSDGIAALRHALLAFPKTFSPELASKPEARSLDLLLEAWRKDKSFSLT